MFVCHIQCQDLRSTRCSGCGSTVVFDGDPPRALVDITVPLSARAIELHELLPPVCDNPTFQGCRVTVAHNPALDEATDYLYADVLGTELSRDALAWVQTILRSRGDVPDTVRHALRGEAQHATLTDVIVGCEGLRQAPGVALVL